MDNRRAWGSRANDSIPSKQKIREDSAVVRTYKRASLGSLKSGALSRPENYYPKGARVFNCAFKPGTYQILACASTCTFAQFNGHMVHV
eukprot:548947-Pelagomonas_calceolata.AAC.4